jgi:hypothetical protein
VLCLESSLLTRHSLDSLNLLCKEILIRVPAFSYTGDEPDGWEYAVNSTTLAYNLITSMDKYHPFSLVIQVPGET